MQKLLEEITQCSICKSFLPLGPRPIISASCHSKIVIIGQAPGLKVHESGIAWNDASGKQLRKWLNVSNAQFYNPDIFAIMPMGFCYPGKGKTGDLPPRPECAPQWHKRVLEAMVNVKLIILIGAYAQNYYLKEQACKTLTETVKNYKAFLPKYLPLPHPSPRNRFWLAKNPWFEKEVIPELQSIISILI